MKNHLPLKIKPLGFCDRGEVLTGTLALADCPRLRALLVDSAGEIAVRLTFGRSDDGRRCVRGEVQTAVRLACQRCGEPVSYDISTELQLSPVMSDAQAAELPKNYDPLLLADGASVSLVEMVEEELLLGLPMFAKHKPGHCPAKTFNEG